MEYSSIVHRAGCAEFARQWIKKFHRTGAGAAIRSSAGDEHLSVCQQVGSVSVANLVKIPSFRKRECLRIEDLSRIEGLLAIGVSGGNRTSGNQDSAIWQQVCSVKLAGC